MLKHSCKNCCFCNFVYEFKDKDGKIKWCESYNGRIEFGDDKSPNAYYCMRYSPNGDKIESPFVINECDDFTTE